MESSATIYAEIQNGIPQPLSLLHVADREALQALYTLEYVNGEWQDLGPWESTSTHFAGHTENMAFGVALRNSYSEPWSYGYRPTANLASNISLPRTAVWNGGLGGFTPNGESVAGQASIIVNTVDLAGSAEFTNLQMWAAGIQPNVGTGTQWDGGDLHYDIAITGNTFRETTGDDGRLTGIFAGRNHEAAGGTLERDDLTAAFGAERQ